MSRHRSSTCWAISGGVRTNLENQGIYLFLDATAEFAGNVSGGEQAGRDLRQSGRRSRPTSIGSAWPGITGLSTHMIIVNRSGLQRQPCCSATMCCRCRRSMAPAATLRCISSRPMPSRNCSTSGWTSPPGG